MLLETTGKHFKAEYASFEKIILFETENCFSFTFKTHTLAGVCQDSINNNSKNNEDFQIQNENLKASRV